MKYLWIILAFVTVAQAVEVEEANLSSNWTTTNGNPWLYQYFQADGVRTNMTQDCTGTTGSNYQCWKSGVSAQTSTSLYPLTYNISAQVGAGGGAAYPGLAFKYNLTKLYANYTANLTFWNTFGGQMNYTISLNTTVKCSGTLAAGAGVKTVANCIIGTFIPQYSAVELDLESNGDSTGDLGNFTFVIRNRIDNALTIGVVTPVNNTVNTTLVIPFGFTTTTNLQLKNATIYSNITGWIPLAYNQTPLDNTGVLTWINATFPRSGGYKFAIQACDVFDFCNITANYTLNVAAPRLFIHAQDDTTLANLLFTTTIANGTNTTTYAATTAIWFNKTVDEIPTGNLTVTIANNTYFSRSYQIFFNGNSSDTTINAYLLNSTDPYSHLVSLTVKDLTGNQVQNALIQIQKLVNGVYSDVANAYTDSSGTASFFMDALTQYNVIISKAGFQNNTGPLVPASTQYTYTLSGANGGNGYSGMFTDTTYGLDPVSLSNYTIAVTGTTSTTGTLAYTALRLTLGNGTQICFTNDTTPSGAVVNCNVDATGWNNTNITAILQIKKDALPEFNFTYYYYIYNFTQWDSNASLTGLFANLANANMSRTTQFTFATLTGTLAATGGWLAAGPVGAGFVFIAVECLWAAAGWIEWNLIYLLTLLVMAIIVLNRF